MPAESETGEFDLRSGQLGAKTLESWGVAEGSARYGVSSRTVLGPLYLTAVHLHLSFRERAPNSAGGGFRPPCVSSRLGPRIMGAITPIMSYFFAFVTGGGLLLSAAAMGGEVLRGGLGCTGSRSSRALYNPLMRLSRSLIFLEG